MSRHILTDADKAKAALARSEGYESAKVRRLHERALLNRMMAEAAMPEWYPHQ